MTNQIIGSSPLVGSANHSQRYAFSGADARAYAWLPVDPYAPPGRGNFSNPRFLESLHTISFSIHEPRGTARALGYRAVKGFSRSVRMVAGSMIFTVIDDHPLRMLLADDVLYGSRNRLNSRFGTAEHVNPSDPQAYRRGSEWSVDMGDKGVGHPLTPPNSFSRTGDRVIQDGLLLDEVLHSGKVATMLSPFDFLLVYTTEVAHLESSTVPTDAEVTGAAFSDNPGAIANPSVVRHRSATAALLLQGVELFDQGLVTSVNDVVSEMTFNFVCRDIKDFAAFSPVVPDQIARELAQGGSQTFQNPTIEDSVLRREGELAYEIDRISWEEGSPAAGGSRDDARVLSEGGTSVSIEAVGDSDSIWGQNSVRPGATGPEIWGK